MHRHPHILSASTNLLAVCFVIIGGLKFSDLNGQSYADEAAWTATALFFASALFSYIAIRNNDARAWHTNVADWSFLAGLVVLMAAVLLAAIFL